MLASKAFRTRISVRKEFIEQNRLRLGFERKLRLQVQTLLAETGQQAQREYSRAGRLVRSGPDFTNKLSNVLSSHYRAVIDAFGLRILRQRKAESQFESLIQQYITQFGAVRVTQVSNTTMQQIRRVILAGEKEGLGNAVIARNIFESQRGTFSKFRSATIARTETHSAASYANHEVNASLKIPNQKKRWVATADARTRSTHLAANGTEIDLDEDFIVGGVAMRYTGDILGGAANVINCRCITIYVTPEDDVFVDEDTPVPQKPIKEPLPERNRDAPIQPTDLAALKIISKKEVEKTLTQELAEANADPRYLNRSVTHYRGHKPQEFGKATMGRLITDESATVILALKREIDQITDQVNLPRIRGIVVKPSKSHNMAMGDGILSINPDYVNFLVGKRLGKEFGMSPVEKQRLVQKLADDIQPTVDEYQKNKDRMTVLFNEINDNKRSDFSSLDEYFDFQRERRLEYEKLGKKNKRLYTKIVKNRNERDRLLAPEDSSMPVSDWNPSKPINERPFSSKDYLADPLDRVRHTMYHEVGHQIHQTYKMTAKSSFAGSARDRAGQEPLWTQTSRPLDSWLESARTERILYGGGRSGKLKDPSVAKETWSTYGNYNGAEWFAENNANYWKGHRDRVDPKFITMMENILDGKDANDDILR